MALVTVQKNVPLGVVPILDLVLEVMECAVLVCIDFISIGIIQKIINISVQLTCGQTSSENCTYFQSNSAEIGQCRIKICPCNDNICQLRLDFQTFVINQPKTSKSCLSPGRTLSTTSYFQQLNLWRNFLLK